MPGNRNVMYLVIGVLIVAVGVLGYNLYRPRRNPRACRSMSAPTG